MAGHALLLSEPASRPARQQRTGWCSGRFGCEANNGWATIFVANLLLGEEPLSEGLDTDRQDKLLEQAAALTTDA